MKKHLNSVREEISKVKKHLESKKISTVRNILTATRSKQEGKTISFRKQFFLSEEISHQFG